MNNTVYIIYILLSEKDGKHYVGQTNNLERRIQQHNNGKVVSTKHRRPLKIIYKEIFSSRNESLDREQFFKTQRGRNKLNNILKNI